MPVFPEKFYSIKEREILLPKLLELTYTSWDIKAFADDLWREADDQLRAAIQAQWESNRAETGGHEWALPEWKGAYPEIAWEREAGCPLPPFKWDDNRRARLQAELDAYYAKLYGLSRDELRYILDPQDVYGEDFPGETFRVLKEKELKQYGEYRTRRLVLEAYDALSWFDEQAQVEKLEGLMEEYRREGAKSAQPPAEAEKQKVYPLPAQPARAAESEPAYPAGSLFSPPQQSASSTAGPAIQLNSKVIIEDDSGARYEYHVHPQAKKGQYSGTCRQVGPYSPLYLSMKGKRVGERFEFGGKGYRVVEVG